MSKFNRVPALSPTMRARLAREEEFDARGGVWFDDEGSVTDRQEKVFVVKVARAPVAVAAKTLTRVRAMADGCAQDIADTGAFHKRNRKYHG